MKTFNDLVFAPHDLSDYNPGAEQARLVFPNGYGVSVITGDCFYCNGSHTDYELAITDAQGKLVYGEITDWDVSGYLSKEEVTELMEQVQALEPNSYGQEEPDILKKYGLNKEAE